MKKSTIGVIIVAVVMILTGVCLCIGGVAAAGGIEAAKDAMVKRGIDLSYVYTLEKDKDGWDIAQSTNENPRLSGNEFVSGLDLEIGAANVEIVIDSSVSEIDVQASNDFNVYVKNRVLHVKTNNIVKDQTVILKVPQNFVFDNVEIQGNACEITIPYMEARAFDVEADAGNIVIDELVSDQAEFEIGAGDICVNHGKVLACDVNVGMGNFEYHGSITKHGDIEAGMGNAELYLDANENDYNYEVECGAGNVTIGESDYSGISVKKMVNNNADAMIEIDCGVGNVKIEF